MPCFAKDAKGINSPFPRHSWVDSAEHVLVALLDFLGSVVCWYYKPEIKNSCLKVPGTPPAQGGGNNYQLQLQVTVTALQAAWCSSTDEGGCGIMSVFLGGRGRARSTEFLLRAFFCLSSALYPALCIALYLFLHPHLFAEGISAHLGGPCFWSFANLKVSQGWGQNVGTAGGQKRSRARLFMTFRQEEPQDC